jgi:acyl-CoA thioesterase-1
VRAAPRLSPLLLAAALGWAGACGESASRDAAGPAAEAPEARRDAPAPGGGTAAPAPAAGPEAAAVPVVVFLGDSLTAGYQLPAEVAFPAVLERRFAAEGLPFRAVNAGTSGDTSAGGLARLDWVLRAEPDVVVVELGANDALRGQDLVATEENLRRIIARLQSEGVRVLLAGVRVPPNYGPEYGERFVAMYGRLAEETDVPLVPFLLAGVGGEEALNLGDGLHPNEEGHRRVADNVAPHLRPLLAAVRVESAGAPATPPP